MDDNASQRPPGVKPRPQLTKAERRELQEKQKAAKIVANAGPAVAKSASSPTSDKPRKSLESKLNARTKSVALSSAKDTASVGSVDTENVLRDLRIFSHFVPSGKSVGTASKVEIHPAIVRLALQFSEFKIVGGNARCIATVNALKEVLPHGFAF